MTSSSFLEGLSSGGSNSIIGTKPGAKAEVAGRFSWDRVYPVRLGVASVISRASARWVAAVDGRPTCAYRSGPRTKSVCPLSGQYHGGAVEVRDGLRFWFRFQGANGGRSWSRGVALPQPLAKFLRPLRMLLAARRPASHLDGSPGVSPHQRGLAVREPPFGRHVGQVAARMASSLRIKSGRSRSITCQSSSSSIWS